MPERDALTQISEFDSERVTLPLWKTLYDRIPHLRGDGLVCQGSEHDWRFSLTILPRENTEGRQRTQSFRGGQVQS